MNPEIDFSEAQRSSGKENKAGNSESQQEDARDEVHGVRRMGDDQAKVPPSVPKGSQMRGASTPVRTKRHRHLANVEVRAMRVDHHFRREFHSRRPRADLVECLGREAADPAMEIADGGVMETAGEARKDRVTDVAVQRRHRAGLDAASEAVAHDQVRTFAKFADHSDGIDEVIAAVRIGHDDILASCRLAPANQRRAVATLADWNDAGTECPGKGLAAVGRTVVGNDDLPGEAICIPDLAQRFIRVRYAMREAFNLVQAGHDDRHVDVLRRRDCLCLLELGREFVPHNFPRILQRRS